jgi:hypothetical protein
LLCFVSVRSFAPLYFATAHFFCQTCSSVLTFRSVLWRMSRKKHDVTIQETVNCINCALTFAVCSALSGVTDHCVVHQEVGYVKMIELTFAWKVTVPQLHTGQQTEERTKHRDGCSMNGSSSTGCYYQCIQQCCCAVRYCGWFFIPK